MLKQMAKIVGPRSFPLWTAHLLLTALFVGTIADSTHAARCRRRCRRCHVEAATASWSIAHVYVERAEESASIPNRELYAENFGLPRELSATADIERPYNGNYYPPIRINVTRKILAVSVPTGNFVVREQADGVRRTISVV